MNNAVYVVNVEWEYDSSKGGRETYGELVGVFNTLTAATEKTTYILMMHDGSESMVKGKVAGLAGNLKNEDYAHSTTTVDLPNGVTAKLELRRRSIEG